MQIDSSFDIAERISGYVSEAFLAGNRNVHFTPQTSLLGSRIIDSLGILEMIEYMEREFGITVEETEMIPENLDSIESMSKFVQHKIGG